MYLKLASVFIAALASMLVLVTLIIFLRHRVAFRLSALVEELRERFEDYQSRYMQLEKHVMDYSNSLGPTGAKLMMEIRELMSTSHALLQECESLLSTGDTESMADGVEMLEDPAASRFELRRDWEERLEKLLQELGGMLSIASTQASELGIPKRDKGQSTLVSLFKARIHFGKGPLSW